MTFAKNLWEITKWMVNIERLVQKAMEHHLFQALALPGTIITTILITVGLVKFIGRILNDD